MTTTLTPDLLAASEAAGRSAAHHERLARVAVAPWRRQDGSWLPPDHAAAAEHRARSLADRLESWALLAEHRAARAEREQARAVDPRPQPDPPASEDARLMIERAER